MPLSFDFRRRLSRLRDEHNQQSEYFCVRNSNTLEINNRKKYESVDEIALKITNAQHVAVVDTF